MTLSKQDYELIEKSLEETSSVSDKTQVKKRMNESDEFSAEIRLGKEVITALRNEHNREVKSELRSILRKVFPQNEPIDVPDDKQSTIGIKKLLYAAASLALLITVFYYVTGNQHPSINELFEVYYQPYPPAVVSRGSDNSSEAMSHYQDGNYTEALQLLEQNISDFHNRQIRQTIYLGVCYLELSNFDAARKSFGLVAAEEDAIFKQTGEWYLALTHLKSGDIASCRALLNSIATPNHLYGEQATLLINQL